MHPSRYLGFLHQSKALKDVIFLAIRGFPSYASIA
jgi:hypothetical protein